MIEKGRFYRAGLMKDIDPERINFYINRYCILYTTLQKTYGLQSFCARLRWHMGKQIVHDKFSDLN